MNAAAGEVRFGTAGWSFPDWYGTFYPAPPRDDGPGALFTGVLEGPPDPDVALARRHPLRYYARFFDAVEVNATFYRVPSARTAGSWLAATEEDPRGGPRARPFLFTLKLPSVFTHDADLDPRVLAAFRSLAAPLRERGRLAGLLAQFPHRFAFGGDTPHRHLDLLRELADLFLDDPLVVEVRHASWAAGEARAFLRELGAVQATVDQPQGRATLAPLEPEPAEAAPELAYVRLHGRNAAAWFDRGAGRDSRYDYLYGPAELDEWATRIDALAGRARTTLVIANNHFRGQAPANALELRALRGEPVRVPPPLVRTYPRLGALP